jgi:hypothetical protein
LTGFLARKKSFKSKTVPKFGLTLVSHDDVEHRVIATNNTALKQTFQERLIENALEKPETEA